MFSSLLSSLIVMKYIYIYIPSFIGLCSRRLTMLKEHLEDHLFWVTAFSLASRVFTIYYLNFLLFSKKFLVFPQLSSTLHEVFFLSGLPLTFIFRFLLPSNNYLISEFSDGFPILII